MTVACFGYRLVDGRAPHSALIFRILFTRLLYAWFCCLFVFVFFAQNATQIAKSTTHRHLAMQQPRFSPALPSAGLRPPMSRPNNPFSNVSVTMQITNPIIILNYLTIVQLKYAYKFNCNTKKDRLFFSLSPVGNYNQIARVHVFGIRINILLVLEYCTPPEEMYLRMQFTLTHTHQIAPSSNIYFILAHTAAAMPSPLSLRPRPSRRAVVKLTHRCGALVHRSPVVRAVCCGRNSREWLCVCTLCVYTHAVS